MSSKWVSLQAEFLIAHAQTKIKAKDWCDSKNLNYETARRYIKPQKPQPKDKAKADSVPAVKAANAKKLGVSAKLGAPFGSQNALKHGGYSKYFKDPALGVLVEATTLDDELALCRSRIHLVIQTIEAIQAQLDKHPSVEVSASLFDSLFKAEFALDKNIARVESITKTLSTIELDNLNQGKIMADTNRSIELAKAAVVNTRRNEVQTELIELQVMQARKDAGGTSKLDEFIDELTGGDVDKVVG
ncbi:terminase [Shewanella hanedai]|uniref:Terminase n=1 Tax=Shewanella hanedai TaxID=25 RepID=A0A553JMZ4_SHEHA|nr:hypothetical protein [Shewanella hanedai]TRY13834.1 hypothetical protein FN961_13020 [Shewanella hanedai]GGI85701.1 terminase [Shewanella hanedai]